MFSNTGPLTLLPYHVSPSPYLYLKCHLPTCLPVWITRKLLIFQSLAKRSFLRESFSNACSIWQTYTCPVLILYLVSTSCVANTSRHHIMHQLRGDETVNMTFRTEVGIRPICGFSKQESGNYLDHSEVWKEGLIGRSKWRWQGGSLSRFS